MGTTGSNLVSIVVTEYMQNSTSMEIFPVYDGNKTAKKEEISFVIEKA